jgi:hypothetical protein
MFIRAFFLSLPYFTFLLFIQILSFEPSIRQQSLCIFPWHSSTTVLYTCPTYLVGAFCLFRTLSSVYDGTPACGKNVPLSHCLFVKKRYQFAFREGSIRSQKISARHNTCLLTSYLQLHVLARIKLSLGCTRCFNTKSTTVCVILLKFLM